MATPIDDKVVAMSFESEKFESGVNNSLSALDKLKAALKFPNAGKDLGQIDAAAKRMNFSHIARALQDIKDRLNALRLTAIAVFSSIVTQGIQAGSRLVKAFTLDPLKAGFAEYTTNLNAVQTILANTQAAGTGLKDVNKALQELNEYSDRTIYNFSQMAKNIGTFTAAGVELDTATNAIKGIANLAALSGSNAEQASTAMYQLSQAISAGRVSLQDWNSVVNAGMGGTVFQRALAQTAEAMGTLKEGTVKLTGPMKNVSIAGESFRQSLQAGPGKASWLTSEVLTKTLEQFTGDLSKAELKAQGFNDAQIKAIQQTATTAMKAATEVKTLEGVLTTARETAGSGWAKTWQIIFGDFAEAKTLFTGISNAVNGFINASADARNKVLGDWKALGGRTLLINSIKTAFQNLNAILKPIKDAFRDIFPAKTGKDLFTLTQRFAEFAKALKPSENTIDGLRRTFRGFFALLSIGGQIIKGIFTVFGQLFGVVGEGSGGFLNFTGNIGDWLVAVDAALKKGNRLTNFFKEVGEFIAAPLRLLAQMADALGNLFAGFSPGGFSDELDGITQSMTPLQRLLEGISNAWLRMLDSISNSGPVLKPVLDAFVDLVDGLGLAIGEAAANMNFEAILETIRTGLLVGIFVMFKRFLGKGTLGEMLAGAGGGILGNIAGSFEALRGSMVAMQQNIKAKTLKEIAIAIALLTASVVALSFVDPERLKSSLTAMTVAFAQLLGAMAILGNISKSLGFVKIPVIAASMILLAGAITVLSAAVVILSRLSWEELAKGLTGVAVLLAGISAAVIPLSANSAGMVRAGVGILAIAVAMKILASAVKDFAEMSWGEIGKGLAGVAGGLTIIAAAMSRMPKSLLLTGAGLVVVAAGLKLLASAVQDFGDMDLRTMGTGLAGIGAALVIIAGAMKLMPKSTLIMAAGLAVVALSLGKIADAIEKMGGMDIRVIAKGLGTLAGALIILAAALHAMKGTIGGSIALAAAATGVALLAPALKSLGRQSWGQILKSLVTLGAALTVLGVAGLLLAPTIPALLGLGAALLLIGGGLALAGTGIALIAAGLSALAVAAPTGVAVLIAALNEVIQTIPEFAKNLAIGILQMVEVFTKAAPEFVEAMGKIIVMVLDIIIKSAPKMGEAFSALLKAGLKVLYDNSPEIVATGLKLLLDLLKGIRNNIGQITTIVGDIVVKFLQGLANNANRIVRAGTDLLIQFLRGIGNNIGRVVTATLEIITKILATIANNLGRIATAGVSIITRLLSAIAGQVGNIIRAGTNIIVQIITGIGNAGSRIVTAGVQAITKFINAVAKGAVKLADEGFKAIILFMNGIADAINANADEMRAAGARVAFAIVDGMTFGLASKARGLAQQAIDMGKSVIGGLKGALGIRSPSKEAYILGGFVVQGLANGLAQSKQAVRSAQEVGNGVINGFKDVFQIESPSKVMHQIGQFVGEGFANGLRGSTEDIREAFVDMNNKLTDAMVTARETIAKEQEKLDKERAEKKPDEAAIKKSQEIIKQNQDLLARSRAGHILLTKALRDEKAELIGLVNDYEKVGEKLKKAEQALVDARRTRDDAIAGFEQQYSALPEIVREFQDEEGKTQVVEDQLGPYLEALKFRTEAVAAYQHTLQELRKLGLDDATYQKLLREGPENQRFADQLLSGGKTAVQSLNTLDTELMKVSKSLAVSAGKNLYQAGVDAAEGLIKGLKKKRSDIREAMEEIAREMILALKKELKIKSPSEVFAEIGRFSMEGMARGFSDSKSVLMGSVEDAADNAIAAMKSSMRRISNAVTDELNPNPTITPVLDLTQVKAAAGEMASLVTSPLTAAASYSHAAAISAESRNAELEDILAAGGAAVKFEQNNYSPKALSEIEIYRSTKNQLSQLKSVLGAV